MRARRTCCTLARLLAAAAPLQAQLLRGRVRDARTGRALDKAVVVALAADSSEAGRDTTRTDGSFRLPLPAGGVYRLRAGSEDHVPSTSDTLTVAPGDTLRLLLRLSASGVETEKMVAVVERNGRSEILEDAGFYDRQKMGPGLFYTRADFAERKAESVSAFLRTVPGMRAVERGPGRTAVVSGRGGVVCLPRIFVDGTSVATADIDVVATPRDLEGMEVYRGSSEVPVQYGGMRTPCGAIVMWLRLELDGPVDEADQPRDGGGGERPLRAR